MFESKTKSQNQSSGVGQVFVIGSDPFGKHVLLPECQGVGVATLFLHRYSERQFGNETAILEMDEGIKGPPMAFIRTFKRFVFPSFMIFMVSLIPAQLMGQQNAPSAYGTYANPYNPPKSTMTDFVKARLTGSETIKTDTGKKAEPNKTPRTLQTTNLQPPAIPSPLAASLVDPVVTESQDQTKPASPNSKLTALLVETGRKNFQEKCTTCHDAAKSLTKTKSYEDWVETVQKMAGKKDAKIEAEHVEPIATYLAARQVVVEEEKKAENSEKKNQEKFDQRLVSEGEGAFQRKCISCHDANRSLEKQKSFGEWRSTVQRMANKSNANISTGEVESISTYLASRGSQDGSAGNMGGSGSNSSPLSTFASISPLWRGGGPDVQNPGFFPYLFAGAGWQQKDGPLSARITACTACHGFREDPGTLCRLELVEAVARVDVTKILDIAGTGKTKGGIEAGRFVVPFGAFSQQVNPGVYRTVSAPLIFNMGQRAREGAIGDVVLPMPYSDEGAVLNLWSGLFDTAGGDTFSTSADIYLVNGLIGDGSSGINYDESRQLLDNNGRPAFGTRLTMGLSNLRAGVSYMTGRYNDLHDVTTPNVPGLNYNLYGIDLMYNHKDLIRFQTEFAARCNDKALIDSSTDTFNGLTGDGVYGWYAELELKAREGGMASLLGRFDYMGRSNSLPPDESPITSGSYHVLRYTGGINFRLYGNSLLMLNYERWEFPQGLNASNIFGIRYNITF